MASALRTEESGGTTRAPPSSATMARGASVVGLDTRIAAGDVDVLCAQSHALHVQRCAQSAGQLSFAQGTGAAAGACASMTSVLPWLTVGIILSVFGTMLMESAVPHGGIVIGIVMLVLVLLEADPRGLHELGSPANETSEAHVYGNALVF